MPLLITPGTGLKALAKNEELDNAVIALVPRNCQLKEYRKLKNILGFEIKGPFIAYASPDSTYAVTRRLLDEAQKEILIGIYDFSAEYMKQILLNAMQRGVKVSLMLDIDSKQEQELFDDLAKFGCVSVEAPSCASKVVHYFTSSHEKVIIIDGTWCLVQSGNYSNNSIPFNEKDGGDPKHFVKGNRDMGVAIKSKELSDFFSKVLKSDMKLELDAKVVPALVEGMQALEEKKSLPDLVEFVPKALPKKLFPSKSFTPTKPIKVTPVLTPDNYLDIIPAFLASAKKSILIENQYIRSSQPAVIKLLEAIKQAKSRNPKLDVRIILGKIFSQQDVPKEEQNIARLKEIYGLVLDKNIRYIDTTRFLHCHNKTIIIDNKAVLISSQNWSDTAVSSNREAGVIMEFPNIAKYYAEIFESDWSTAQTKIPSPGKTTIETGALTNGNFIKVVPADYQEV